MGLLIAIVVVVGARDILLRCLRRWRQMRKTTSATATAATMAATAAMGKLEAASDAEEAHSMLQSVHIVSFSSAAPACIQLRDEKADPRHVLLHELATHSLHAPSMPQGAVSFASP